MNTVLVPTNYYQHFDADFSLDVPGEGYGGWKKTDLKLNLDTTAVVVMHAWDTGTREQYPGWHRTVEYMPRANEICRDIFPSLLSTVRASGVKLFHVVSSNDYYSDKYPGFNMAKELADKEPEPFEQVEKDSVLEELLSFKSAKAFPGTHNQADIREGFKNLNFPKEAEPQGNEGVAATPNQLFALCKEQGINHLIYTGFAINWCLLLSPGGMADMSQRGIMCSAIRQAVTAVENKETAREELCKELALWRVALAFGFVYDLDDFRIAIKPEYGGGN